MARQLKTAETRASMAVVTHRAHNRRLPVELQSRSAIVHITLSITEAADAFDEDAAIDNLSRDCVSWRIRRMLTKSSPTGPAEQDEGGSLQQIISINTVVICQVASRDFITTPKTLSSPAQASRVAGYFVVKRPPLLECSPTWAALGAASLSLDAASRWGGEYGLTGRGQSTPC